MSEVFLSYARADEAVARRIAKALEAVGYDVWWDSHLPAHRAYSEEIERRLEEAEAVVVLWSQSAAQSQWVRAEADFARGRGKLVQAQLGDTLPPMPFNQIQCAALKGWRGGAAHAGWAKLSASVASLVREEKRSTPAEKKQRRWDRPQIRGIAAAAVVLSLLLAAFAAMMFLRSGGDEKPVVAVLPFESLNRRDESLVSGIWEDTRQAIGRNPQLTVLGPNSAREIDRSDDDNARKIADYLVEASVRSAGDRIRISANLVRTRDGAQIWSKSFDRKLDDIFATQSEIAREIEGHIRGRLAERGGTKPENIATSGEVYALYNDARAIIRRRDNLRYGEAHEQLLRIVKMDPNFAPGWATLSIVDRFGGRRSAHERVGFASATAERNARRAIELAPNLAAGHAALGFALRSGPAAEAALVRAIQLDPNDFESLGWLANLYKGKGELGKAQQYYTRAVEVEPLFWPAVLNKLDLMLNLGDTAAVDREWQRIQTIGNPMLTSLAGMAIAVSRGDLSEATKIGMKLLNDNPNETRGVAGFQLFSLLLQLGFEEEARRAFPPPPFGPLLWANDPRGLDLVERMKLRPEQFFAMHPLPMNAGRVYILAGRGTKLAALYRQAATGPEDMIRLAGSEIDFATIAPFIALALRQAGDAEGERQLLLAAERVASAAHILQRSLKQALLARIHAVQGRNEQAVKELDGAVRGGWLPMPPELPVDIATDPAFGSIKADPRFEAVRQKILRHIAKERAELGPVRVS